MLLEMCCKLNLRIPKMWQLNLLITLIALFCITGLNAECNVCQENTAACINSTSFYLCFGENEPDTRTLYHCKEGFECTDLNAICAQASSQRKPSCGDTALCGMCSAQRNYLFACMSRTTFQMCYGAVRPIGQIGYCPEGYLCDADSDSVCVPEDMVDEITCDMMPDNNSSSTNTPSPTPPEESTEDSTPSYKTPDERCKELGFTSLYPTMPVDPYCKRYLSCYQTNGEFKGTEYSCSSGTYYHIQQEQCVLNKPTYCM